MKTIGERIKNAREAARNGQGVSQKELAEITGIKQAALSQIEADKNNPRKPTLIALGVALGSDFEEEWLRDFFKSVAETDRKEFTHSFIANLFSAADELDEKSIVEMGHIWEMLKSEIKRRKKVMLD